MFTESKSFAYVTRFASFAVKLYPLKYKQMNYFLVIIFQGTFPYALIPIFCKFLLVAVVCLNVIIFAFQIGYVRQLKDLNFEKKKNF